MNTKYSSHHNLVTCKPFPSSGKIYVPGNLHNIKVAMREISLSPTNLANGTDRANVPLTVYDTSGPYTDPDIVIDLKKGLPRLCEEWIMQRGDVKQLPDFSSEYGRQRMADSRLDDLRFKNIRKPLKAKSGKNISQMYYARQGIITPEFVRDEVAAGRAIIPANINHP